MLRRLSRTFTTISVENPYSYDLVTEIDYLELEEANSRLNSASTFQKIWKATPIKERVQTLSKAWEFFSKNSDRLANEVTIQMGKPIVQSRKEIVTMTERATAMCEIAESALADHLLEDIPGRLRMIRREPVGVVLQIAPWNYPYLTVINAMSAAVLAGNAVMLKHSSYTPLCGEHFAEAFAYAGVPELVQSCFLNRNNVGEFIGSPEIGYVSLCGSTAAGRDLYRKVAEKRFIDVGLELGGKDCAYVAEDVDPIAAAAAIVDGCLYNAGQSCCAIERVYVHASVYEAFMDEAERLVKGYTIGNPLDEATSIGPLTLPDSPQILSERVMSALESGAHVIVGGTATQDVDGNGRFFNPTLVTDVDETMDLFAEESFGPIVAVCRVKNDSEAVVRMNTNKFGLTNSIFTTSRDRALKMASDLEAGTIFMNKSDFVDPYLAWTGFRQSGKGSSCGHVGFQYVTRPKSYNFVG